MKYMLLIYGSERAWSALEPDDFKKLAAAHAAVQAELIEHDELIASSELDEKNARTVRSLNGEMSIDDGPFSEGQQIVSGYYLIDCVDMDRAVEIASRFAEAEFAPIEVRQLGEGSTWINLLTPH